MIDLDYTLSPSWKRSWEALDLAAASETDLLYSALLGDISVKIDSNDFSAKWGWIPVVGFAASLRHIVGELAEGDGVETTFDFTESDAVLRFKRAKDGILVSASYAPGEACVLLTEFAAAVNSFSRRVARELSQQFPPLHENESFQQLLSVPAQ